MSAAAKQMTAELYGHPDMAGDQARFMQAGGQTVGIPNWDQVSLYVKLIDEEVNKELLPHADRPGAVGHDEYAARLADDAIDTIVVSLGLLHSLGIDPDEAWREVIASNMSKIDPETGRVLKRDDGKLLKPASFVPPDMLRVVRKAWGIA